MPPTIRKYSAKNKIIEFKSSCQMDTIDKNENASSKLQYKQKNDCVQFQPAHVTNSNNEFDELLSSPLKQNVNLQPLSFWSKKLKELESKETPEKAKCRLYEFSTSEDSFVPNKKKKNVRKKGRVKKKKQQPEFNIKYHLPTRTTLRTKDKDLHKKLTADDKGKENNKLVDKFNECKATKTISSVMITSTPVPNRKGLADMSNFLFSPIEKKQENDFKEINKKQINIVSKVISPPKTLFRKITKMEIEPNQDNCIRVLRNRKILLS